MKPKLETIEIYTNPNKKFNSTVIWMHGLGADGYDFVPVIEQFRNLKNKDIKFILPHAPIRSITINNNMKMRGWFDIYSFDRSSNQDIDGINDSKNLIYDIINNENQFHNIPYENISLAGFSQGGALALFTGLTFPKKLNSILALSCYLPVHQDFLKARTDENITTPIFLAHGIHDPIIPLHFSSESRDILEKLNYNVLFTEYQMEHSVCTQEIKDIDSFYTKHLDFS